MRKIILFLTLSIYSALLFAQDGTVTELKNNASKTIQKDPKDTVQKTWKRGGNFALNINQGSLSNWSAGGDNFSFSLNAMSNMFLYYKKGKHSWDNSLDLAYGIVNTTSLGTRKASDRLDFLTKYGYAIRPKLNIAGLLNVRSQFANGYTYINGVNEKDSAVLVSKSFAPLYVLPSIGLDWRPKDYFSLFVSPITARWVSVSDENIAPLYNIKPGKKVRSEFGAYLSANFNKSLAKNITFKSKLDLFSNYDHNPQNIDVYWSNILTAKVAKYINFSFNVDLIYDDDTHNVKPNKGPAPQILQLMGIGFAYNFKNY